MSGKVAVITGAGRGIGRATAELFAQEGATVVICARTDSELRAVQKAIATAGGTVVARRTDISSPSHVGALVRTTMRRYRRIDILINNAGILGPRVPLVRYPRRQWEEVIRINLTGTFLITQAVARIMARQQSGCIISISSSVGRTGRAEWGAYAVSKFGTEGLSQVLADELRPHGIRVMTFNPGGTRTAMRARAYPREDRSTLHDPEEVARALRQLVLTTSLEHSGKMFDRQTLPDT